VPATRPKAPASVTMLYSFRTSIDSSSRAL
jgi:hypothetical protein